ncbi:uncharacterized protein PODANS_7_2790 [Podospora anserina S mat+]|uniref:Podospora anserina S mat+ genomic DNA chromosome 7, supercontig 1 n=1 Tax=Podospora anserina (strain S / ATCC MYA-4624 / DSM 980 / FGSC 10383) TaxID=515849 RepID=B2AVI9_PODAN|nr:uncharacterized protein PODANS_7_2790 [Podospora anserina S mat+]CAP68413.1 unnamed protein product [Podospora anserina S mat+]
MTLGTTPQRILQRLPFSSSTTPLQALTYLLGISLFSISFLVFLNSSLSFVITDLIGVKEGVGDIVGTLGFVDELVALVACPIWGLVSDRAGVRYVAVAGYAVIGLALFLFVQARNVYPQLLLARIFFAVGATAATSVALSVDSEETRERNKESHQRSPRFVGLFTGCGALVALSLFLPLPARFGKIEGVTTGLAVQYSYYTVGVVSFLVAIFVFFGLRKIKGEEGKGCATVVWSPGLNPPRRCLSPPPKRMNSPPLFSLFLCPSLTQPQKAIPYPHLLRDSILLALGDSDICLGYLGGFVARASTVAISLFIPLYINAFFMRHGYCQGSPNDPSPELKKECRQAYILSAILTGVAQLMGLICAPLFGYLSHKPHHRVNWPIVIATLFGIIGYMIFPSLASPEFKDVDSRGGKPVVFLLVALMGISQIGAIVCSLGSLGKGVLKTDIVNVLAVPGSDGGETL